MFAHLNHLAIVSDKVALVGRFYEEVFGLKTGAKKKRPGRAVSVGDGHVGININPSSPGRKTGLDHFGFDIADVETYFQRVARKYPMVKWQQRPSGRSFAALSTHDPDGNIFDLSLQDSENRSGVYASGHWDQDRRFSHIVLRTLRPDFVATFYQEVLELEPADVRAADGGHCLSDGRMTLIIVPWAINDYADTSILGPGIDHIGLKVESVEAVKRDIEVLAEDDSTFSPPRLDERREQKVRLELLKACPMGQHQMADVGGVLIDICET